MTPYDWIKKDLDTIHRANWYRQTQTIYNKPNPEIVLDTGTYINFASNDYLSLAADERLIQAAIEAIKKWGTGSTGSRLLTGHKPPHQALEQAIANLKQTQAALVYSSGYLANIGTISALVNQKDLILTDEYNHASLIQGAILSGATIIKFKHNHPLELKTKLIQNRSHHRRCLIITETLFSMEGDLAPLPDILELAHHYNSMLLVDEAHATGVLGANGSGGIEHWGCTKQPLIQIGTLSKAFGSLGGYVAGTKDLIEYLRNRSPSWIYTTALSPADTASAHQAIAILQSEPQRRTQLWNNVKTLKTLLTQQTKLPLIPSDSPIICLSCPSAQAALDISAQLKEAHIWVPAIRPPTVPTSRLRISVMSSHKPEHLTHLATTLSKI